MFASYLPVTPAPPVISASGPLPLDYSIDILKHSQDRTKIHADLDIDTRKAERRISKLGS